MEEKKTRKSSAKAENQAEVGEKTVEQINAEKLKELIEKGKKKGKLSAKELLDVLEEMTISISTIDKE